MNGKLQTPANADQEIYQACNPSNGTNHPEQIQLLSDAVEIIHDYLLRDTGSSDIDDGLF